MTPTTKKIKASLPVFNRTKIDVSSIVITYPFYARVKRSTNKQFYSVLYGLNNEPVWCSEPHKNRIDVVKLLNNWFPQIKIKR